MQIITTNCINLVCSLYFIHYRPHPSRILNQMEIFNEGTIVISGIHFTCFTELVWDATAREIAGYSLIIVIVGGFLVNAVVHSKSAAVYIYLVPIREWNWLVSSIGCESLMSYVKPDPYILRK